MEGIVRINAYDLNLLSYEEDYDELMEKQGLKNPWQKQLHKVVCTEKNWFGKPIQVKSLIDAVDAEERAEILHQREQWIEKRNQYCLFKFLEDGFFEQAELFAERNHLEKILNTLPYCGGKNPQCNIFCNYFNKEKGCTYYERSTQKN